MTFPRPNPIRRRRATNTSALAAAALLPYVKIKGGEFTCDGGGSGDGRHEAHFFRHGCVSEPYIGAEPRTAGDVGGRICCHLRRDVPVSRNIAVGVAAAVGARRRVP